MERAGEHGLFFRGERGMVKEKRRRELAFAHVPALGFSRAFGGREIKRVVHHLKGDAEVEAIVGGRPDAIRLRACLERAEFACGADHPGCFAGDDFEIGGKIRGDLALAFEFQDFSPCRLRDCFGRDGRKPGVSIGCHCAVAAGEQGVSGQDGFRHAENPVRGGLAAPQIGVVQHVVVQQCRCMEEFHGGGEGVDIRLAIPEQTGDENGQKRAQSFAALPKHMVRHRFHPDGQGVCGVGQGRPDAGLLLTNACGKCDHDERG